MLINHFWWTKQQLHHNLVSTMPKVNIDHNSPLSPDETFKKVKDMLENDPALKKFDGNLQCNFDDSCHSGDVKGSKFKASVNVEPQGSEGSKVEIVVDLPMLLGPFKGQVKSTIESRLKKVLV